MFYKGLKNALFFNRLVFLKPITMIYILLFTIAFIGLGIWQGSVNNKQEKRFKEQLLSVPSMTPGFTIDKSYLHQKGFAYIALDDTKKQMILGAPMDKKQIIFAQSNDKNAFIITHKLINYKDILKSEIIIDGQSISSKSYSGALMGGLLFGTAGAVVGSSGGKTKHSKDINTIKLKLLLNDIQSPSYEVLFYNKSTDKGILTKAQQSCQNWQDTISVAILN